MIRIICLLTSLTFLMTCGLSDEGEEGLFYIGENPLTITIGDTSETLHFKKTAITDLRGKMTTISPYLHVTLESGDSTRVGIDGLQVIGLQRTSANATVTITATDDNKAEFTAGVNVDVVEE
ncbi:hypothetical protein ACFL5V_07710 [Fibrobacterota bacterium]